MNQVFISTSEEETKQLAEELAGTFAPGLVTLSGELGAGKTSLSGAILKFLGAEGPYQSPTFVLMKEYELPNATSTGIKRVLHADAYRVEAADFEMLGFAEWLKDKEALLLLEWPEKIEALLPEHYVSINLHIESDRERKIVITKI